MFYWLPNVLECYTRVKQKEQKYTCMIIHIIMIIKIKIILYKDNNSNDFTCDTLLELEDG